MRKYSNQGSDKKTEVYCNACGKRLKMQQDMLMEEVFHGSAKWGYFSDKDGENHEFDLCESCYDKWISAFLIPVEKTCQNELL